MTRQPRATRFFSAIFLLCLVLMGSGCRLSYLFHVAKGQIQLLNGAIPISEALNSEPFTPDQRNKLLLVAQIKAFGEEELGLKKTGNYETVYPHLNRNPIYVVSASEKDRFSLKTWWFPIVGHMPYLGFFDLEEAKKERERLLQEDLDVYVGRAGAYSTLGWFQDPVTMNLIDGSTPQLANTLLHELTHATLYVNGQGAFNEGLAVLVGKVGSFQFFEKTFGPAHPFTDEARNALADERLFSRFLNAFMTEMEDVYSLEVDYEEKIALRKTVFAAYHKKFDALKKDFKTRQFVHFGQMPPNNAYLMTVALYHRYFELFEAVLAENKGSVRKMLLFLDGFSQKEGDLMERLRNRVNDSGR
jgi:predicted aminopeptidase